MVEAATMYYLQDETMEVIARRLGVSRSSVSRLLRDARSSGLVRISVRPTVGAGTTLAARLNRMAGVRAHVVPVRATVSDAAILDQVARVAARLLGEWFGSDMVLGVAWGTTIAAVAHHVTPVHTRGSAVVQLNGAANPHTSGITYATDIISSLARAFDASVHHFPVPAFFDYAETKAAMWRERSVRRVLAVQRRADVMVFGVGALSGPLPSHVYSTGYLDDADRETLESEGVVGDVCTVFLREDGSFSDISVNARATGPSPAELRVVPRRVCVVAGEAKVVPLIAALRAGVVTDLVLDERTARALVERWAATSGTSRVRALG